MNVERLKVLIYQFLLYELSRREDAADSYRQLMIIDSADSYSVLKYYSALQELESFRVLMKKINALLENFQ